MEDMLAFCKEICKIYPEKYLEAIDKGIYNNNKFHSMYVLMFLFDDSNLFFFFRFQN